MFFSFFSFLSLFCGGGVSFFFFSASDWDILFAKSLIVNKVIPLVDCARGKGYVVRRTETVIA